MRESDSIPLEEPDQIIEKILQLAAALSSAANKIKLTVAIRDIRRQFDLLNRFVPETEWPIVKKWAEALHDIPTAIGIHPELSNILQERIDGVRNHIEYLLDEEWPEKAGTAIVDQPDSGIDLSPEDSGIKLSHGKWHSDDNHSESVLY
jgi:hypothetical protein